MRRTLVLLLLPAALVATASASGEFQLRPVRRDFGELTLPRVRAGVVHVPRSHARGRITVIVDLRLPPLAAAYGRSVQSVEGSRKLDVSSASSRTYLARVNRAQQAAEAQLRRAIPEARVSRRFRVLLDALTVQLPATRLPALARLSSVRKIYPSLRYTLALDRSPTVIGATALQQQTGARGEGIKIGVVDTGVDASSPFLDPTGFTYPAGFPKGGTKWTTPKVIVARTFPGAGAGARGRLAVDLQEPHGTHVSGIAAGDAGTTAPAGSDHPTVSGLSGVAPRAWIGNYRVFTVPTPIGPQAYNPEIIAAFEAAVRDGMDVINFSGGGPQVDPTNDAMYETVRNVVNAGVVPVIAAGNDRDEFGLGSVGSPGTAPDAITVAAVSNTHVFAPALDVVAPGAPAAVKEIPFQGRAAAAWDSVDQKLVDVGSIVGTDGSPVDRHLCGSAADPNDAKNPLPARSLDGAIALISRGTCTFFSKAVRARQAGAVGLVIVDNRPGEANPIPAQLPLPAGMIADLDGTRLHDYLTANGGRAAVRIGTAPLDIETGRSGIITSFSSAGPSSFGHELKPDISAPGGQVLSSTPPQGTGEQFSVFDGTSMATPHVAGAAALLLELHRDWSPRQIKSALVSTAGPAWGDTARTQEASVLLEGGGLVNLVAANDPKIFSDPVSLSFGQLDVNRGGQSRVQLVTVTDAGGGGGTWQVELQPQSGSSGAMLDVGPSFTLAPGGVEQLAITARASGGAAAGDDYGYVVLHRGDVVRRLPYDFSVTRPGLEGVVPTQLKDFQVGNTLKGASRAGVYRYPSLPFGPPADYTGTPMNESGAEHLYVTHLNAPAANLGVAVLVSSANSLIDPFVLGSPDENNVQGYAGTPVDVNPLTFDFRLDIGAAGAVFPRQQAFYVSVDSGRDPFTGRSLGGSYVLQSWVNDVSPPLILPITTRVAAGRPTIVARVIDGIFQQGSGVDPLSLVIGYRRALVGAAFYDPLSGLALFPLPAAAPRIPAGRTSSILVASDYQESKNVVTVEGDVMPNTSFLPVTLNAVNRPVVTWLEPPSGPCVSKSQRLIVVASAPRALTDVRFFDGKRPIAVKRSGPAGLYAVTWKTKGARRGTHVLRAVADERGGVHASSVRLVRVCK